MKRNIKSLLTRMKAVLIGIALVAVALVVSPGTVAAETHYVVNRDGDAYHFHDCKFVKSSARSYESLRSAVTATKEHRACRTCTRRGIPQPEDVESETAREKQAYERSHRKRLEAEVSKARKEIENDPNFSKPVVRGDDGRPVKYDFAQVPLEDSLFAVRIAKRDISHDKLVLRSKTFWATYNKRRYPVKGIVRNATGLEKFTRSLAEKVYGGSMEGFEIGWTFTEFAEWYFVTIVKGERSELELLDDSELYSLGFGDDISDSGHSHACVPGEEVLNPSNVDFKEGYKSLGKYQVISCRDLIFEWTHEVYNGVPFS